MTPQINARLLLAEDNDTDVLIVLEHLGEAAPWVTVEVAGDGCKALDLMTSGRYDLAVLDLNLPVIDGREVLRRARAEAPDLPILVVTTSVSPTDREVSLELGAAGFAVKPMGLAEYEHMLDDLVSEWLTPGEER